MKKGRVVVKILGAALAVSLIASILMGPVNFLNAQEPYYGVQLLAPNNGCLGVPVKSVSFSWSPFKETTKYKFQLAKDVAMTQIVKEADVTTTAFEYDGTLDYGTNYFWRVMALEPAPSDLSATFNFQTEAAPPPPTLSTQSQWSALNTPVIGKEIRSPSEVNKIVAAANGTTVWVVDIPAKAVRKSSFNGWAWSNTPNAVLHSAMTSAGISEDNQFIWDIVVAPDDANFLAVVTGSATSPDPTEVWLSLTGGTHWEYTGLPDISGCASIGAIDISMDYGGKRDIAVGSRYGVPGTFRIWVIRSVGFDPWKLQTVVPAANADILALKFSPSYFVEATGGDSALAVVYCTDDATYFDIALRDLDPASNDIVSWVYGSSIEVKNPASPLGASPEATTIVNADLELPSNFNGQDANLRRAYISIDDAGAGSDTGIFRVDDNTVYMLMDTTTNLSKRISSIAYFGTMHLRQVARWRSLWLPVHRHGAHLVHRCAHRMSHPVLVSGTETAYRSSGTGHLYP